MLSAITSVKQITSRDEVEVTVKFS